MNDEDARNSQPDPAGLAARDRERAIARLRDHYVRDDIDVEEYERLLDGAWSAGTRTELEALLARLPAIPEEERSPVSGAGAEARLPARAAPGEPKTHGFQLALLGGSERKGAWVPPRSLHTLALMGGAGLDFREARLGPGVTEVTILAVMGGVEIVVSPGMAVETSGFGIMGAFEGHDQAGAQDDPDAPVLRIRGMALMGGIEVKEMLPGETTRDARRRRKEERRRRRLERRSDTDRRGDDTVS